MTRQDLANIIDRAFIDAGAIYDTDGPSTAVLAAADAYRDAALLALAAELEKDAADRMFTGGDEGTAAGMRFAARLARADAGESPS
jgi:hypothetical protein